MKKWLLLTLVIFLTFPAWAQLEQGEQMVSLRGGLGFQLNNSGISYTPYGGTVDWGTLGGDLALSYHYFTNPYIGVGAEISRAHFSGNDLANVGSNHEAEDTTVLYNFMLATRFTANPENRFRIYMPLGAGLVSARQELKINYHNLHHTQKATDNTFGWFIGLGLESDIGQNGWSWGFETRYNAYWFDTDKLVKNAPAGIEADGKRRLEYMTFSLRVSKRF